MRFQDEAYQSGAQPHVGCTIYLRVLEGVYSGFTSALTSLAKYTFILSAPARSWEHQQGEEFLSWAP